MHMQRLAKFHLGMFSLLVLGGVALVLLIVALVVVALLVGVGANRYTLPTPDWPNPPVIAHAERTVWSFMALRTTLALSIPQR
jgi:hypothetical protein